MVVDRSTNCQVDIVCTIDSRERHVLLRQHPSSSEYMDSETEKESRSAVFRSES